MKQILKAFIFIVIASFACVSCGGGNPIKDLEGRWVLDLNGGNDHMGVTINGDGSGRIDMSGIGYNGKNELILMEDVEIEVDGDNVYLYFVDYPENDPAHLSIRDGKLYSNDGQPFRKTQ